MSRHWQVFTWLVSGWADTDKYWLYLEYEKTLTSIDLTWIMSRHLQVTSIDLAHEQTLTTFDLGQEKALLLFWSNLDHMLEQTILFEHDLTSNYWLLIHKPEETSELRLLLNTNKYDLRHWPEAGTDMICDIDQKQEQTWLTTLTRSRNRHD